MHQYDQGSVPQPAVGTDFNNVPNFSEPYRLLTLRCKLVTSAVVATRYPHFQFVTPSGEVVHEIVPQNGQAASLTYYYDLIAGSGSANEGSVVNDNVVSLSLPDLWWPHGTKLQVVTTARDVGDQWSDIYYSLFVGDEWERDRRILEALQQLGG